MAGIPKAIYQALFAFNFLNCLLTLWTILKIVYLLPFLGSQRQRESISIRLSQFFFYNLMLRPCPWVKIHGYDELISTLKSADGESAPFFIANHNSKLDSLLITAIFPSFITCRMRSLIKLALFSEPLFGGICTAVGHFPVYFKGKATGDFSVDKEAQNKVANDMDEFLVGGGGLLIFPEGQLNKEPRNLQTFRHGAFTLPITHKKPIWGFLNVGCDKTWPYTEVMGGFPSDIYVKAFQVTDDASKFDRVELAEHAHKVMQSEMDKIHELIEDNNSKKTS